MFKTRFQPQDSGSDGLFSDEKAFAIDVLESNVWYGRCETILVAIGFLTPVSTLGAQALSSETSSFKVRQIRSTLVLGQLREHGIAPGFCLINSMLRTIL